jgi:hypothetical protein
MPPEVRELALRQGGRLNRYVLLAPLGEGGMGVVHSAWDTELEREVALKILTNGTRPEQVERFLREAEAMARLRHPNVVGIHEVGAAQGVPFLSMELVAGGSLEDLLLTGPLELQRTAEVALDVARGLAHAHAQGVVHRDLKPANVLLDGEGKALLTDFGLARLIDTDEGLTKSGQVVGTPHYMSPEQALGKGRHATPASDVFGLGAVIYRMAEGAPPFDGETLLELVRQIATCEPRTVEFMDPALSAIVACCLEKDPEDRYSHAGEVAAELERYLKGEAVEALASPLPTFVRGAVIGLALMLPLLGWALWYASTRHVKQDEPRAAATVPDAAVQAMEDALAACARGNLAQTRQALSVPALAGASREVRMGLKPVFEGALELALAREGEELFEALELAGAAQALVGEVRWSSSVPTSLVDAIRVRGDFLVIPESLATLEVLARERLRPSPRSLLALFDVLSTTVKSGAGAGESLGVYLRALSAAVALGMPLVQELHFSLPRETRLVGEEPAQKVVRACLALIRDRSKDGSGRHGLLQLIEDRALPPLLLLNAVSMVRGDITRRSGSRELLEEALAKEPDSALGWLALGALHKQRFQAAVWRKDRSAAEAAREEAERACDRAWESYQQVSGNTLSWRLIGSYLVVGSWQLARFQDAEADLQAFAEKRGFLGALMFPATQRRLGEEADRLREAFEALSK